MKKGSFGSSLPRDTLIFRDITKSPYKNPSNLENPAPDAYNTQKFHEMSSSI
jgi:hypothetical protein